MLVFTPMLWKNVGPCVDASIGPCLWAIWRKTWLNTNGLAALINLPRSWDIPPLPKRKGGGGKPRTTMSFCCTPTSHRVYITVCFNRRLWSFSFKVSELSSFSNIRAGLLKIFSREFDAEIFKINRAGLFRDDGEGNSENSELTISRLRRWEQKVSWNVGKFFFAVIAAGILINPELKF